MNTSANTLPGLPGSSLAEVAQAAAVLGTVAGGPVAPVAHPVAQVPAAPAIAAQAGMDVAAEARKAEQGRIAGIIGHAEASGREALAQHLAFTTTMTVEAAAAILAAAPKAGAPVPAPAAAQPTPVQTLAGQMAVAHIGAVPPAAGDQAVVSNVWKSAIDNVNRGQAAAPRR
jgi:hypothetical protein